MLAETNALFGENEAAAVKSAQGQGDPKLVSAAGQAGGHESSGLNVNGTRRAWQRVVVRI